MEMIEAISLLLLIISAITALWLFQSDPKPINGVYSLPNKWYQLKYRVFRILLWLRKRQQHQKVDGGNAGMGRKSRNSPEEMDQVQRLDPSEPQAVDAVYIMGSNADGQFVVTATARRPDSHIQTLLFLRIPEVGFMQLPSIPDTSLLGTHKDEYAAGGLHLTVVEPMNKWNIKFDGKLRVISTGQLLYVKFNLDWVACTDYFDFDTDMHQNVMCDAIAREMWSRQFFDKLKSLHQTHYEQFGDIKGTVNIEGQGQIQLHVRGVRDHSYGKIRNWRQLHRYCIQYASFQDGTCLCIAAISMPDTMTRLHCGYLFHPSGKMESMSWCDLELCNLGDDGTPVNHFTVNFIVGNIRHKLEVTVLDATLFYIGDATRDAKIYERYCRYILDDEQEGHGVSEWEYRNTDGSDPVNEQFPGIQYYTK